MLTKETYLVFVRKIRTEKIEVVKCHEIRERVYSTEDEKTRQKFSVHERESIESSHYK